MALFSRRFLQRVLDESSTYLSLKQREDTCKLLNTVRDDYLATEWELAILNAVNGFGTVRYEPNLGGTRHPDFLFDNGAGLCFVADVTSVSDRGIHKQNPVEALHEEFRRQQRKLGILSGGFDVRVNAHSNHLYRGSRERPRLKLPKISEFKVKIFGAEFRTFMETVRHNPELPAEFEVNRDDTSVQFSYNPSRRGFGGGSHPSFDFAAIIDQNPVYNALSSKAEQLRDSGFDGSRGIFLCDGGCRILHDKFGNWASYNLKEVVSHFLRQHRSVLFVVALIVAPNAGRSSTIRDVHIEANLFMNDCAVELRSALESVVKQVVGGLPMPEQSPVNALNHLKGRNGMAGRHLGTLTHGGSIEMSARMLLEILAGKLTIEDFDQEYRMKPEENPFRLMLAQGRLLKSVTIEPHPDKDDDRAVIRFGEPDTAVSPFRAK